MGLFTKKSPKEKLQKKYEKLLKEAYQLSHSDRTAADKKTAEAEKVLEQMELL
ncbi:MAG: Lacal_2735 family protein [Bacteroidota bacterium]|nr:Lacal_2735 family protein [Bacteroidota bacterium]